MNTNAPQTRWPVAVLGATGAVGQAFIRCLAGHPWFDLVEVAASERSAGKSYREASRWLEGTLSEDVAKLTVLPCDPSAVKAPIVFSALDSGVAGATEAAFAAAGRLVLSNAKNYRMDEDVPLVIPEVNGDHLGLLARQRRERGWPGGIVTNANCACTVVAMALAPLHAAFGVRKVFVTTLQAISGAGYPGVASLDILGNVIPYIGDEEPKIESEITKLLGVYDGTSIIPANIITSAHANRVPVEHGHTACISVGFAQHPTPEQALQVLREWTGFPAVRGLPSAPSPALIVRDELDRPQPRRDGPAGDGMAVTVGRVRADPHFDLRLVAMAHNVIRGAAGGSILNAELLVATGQLAGLAVSVIVCKFGGTSVQDAAAIDRVVAIIRSKQSKQPIVVVSALGGATNQLLEIANKAAAAELLVALQLTEQLRERHLREAAALLSGSPEADDIATDISAGFDELAHLAEAFRTLGYLTPRSLDTVAAIGELLSSQIIAAAFRHRGLPAVFVDARDVLKTNDQFTRAEPDLVEIERAAEQHLLPLVQRGQIPVMGGFVGSAPGRVTTTLGRGGSDFSASLVGAAVQAEAIEIWTDVDGMLTADPRVVPEARLIERIRFDEAAELASFGAKVLHPSTIAPAVQRGIPVYVFNSRRPEGHGTMIAFEAPRMAVRAIAGKRNTTVIKLRSARMLLAPGFLRRVFQVFETHRTSVDVVATSEVSISVTLDDPVNLDAVVADLMQFGDVAVERHRGIVAIVGAGIADGGRALADAIAALGPIPVYMASLSATGINFTLVIDDAEVVPAMQRLHRTFFGDAA